MSFLPIRRRPLLAASLLSLLSLQAMALTPRALPDAPALTLPPQWRPPAVTSNFPQGQPIQLREAIVDVEVFGGQAQTRIELRLFNPNPRVLEGELQFPLMDGQVVTGFALDVNGRLRDAVAVPKAKGQEIFEDIRRRRVDPGLLEATAGNQYKLRVYPIMGGGERRVALTITEALPRTKDGMLLRVPLAFASSVGRLQVQVRANGLSRADTKLLQAPAELEWADTQGMNGQASTTLRLDKQAWNIPSGPAGWLQLALRPSDKPQLMVGESSGKRYFAGQVPFRDEPVRRAEPRHVALVWDASGSAAAQSRVLPVLEAWFRAMTKPVKVSLIVVRNQAEAPREMTVAPGGFAKLAALLRAEPLDGSSNFDALPIPADTDLTLMVTDGLMTDGKRLINYTHPAPVLVITGSAVADLPRLSRLADRTGGVLVDATRQSPEEAAYAMLHDGWRVAGLQSLAATQLVTPSLRVQQGLVSVAGELLDAQARVEVALVHPSGRKRTLVLQPGASSKGAARQDSRWPAQQWAQWRSAELAENPALYAGELRRIAAEHGIVGPNSSLIVLELAADYARYELPAPPELAAEVAQLAHLQLSHTTQQRQGHIEAMVRQLDDKQRWWDKDFPKQAPPRPAAAKKDEQQRGAIGAAQEQSQAMVRRRESEKSAGESRVMAPMAAARPAPMPAPAMGARAQDSVAENSAASSAAAAANPQAGPQSVISIQRWQPDAPYMQRLQNATTADLYRVYLDERAAHVNSSAFYMDVADLFLARGSRDLAVRVLSNLAEMNLENRQLLRLYAYRLQQARMPERAVPVFERVAELAPNEPQSWRDLGLALSDSGEPQRGVNALWEVVSRPWNGRFQGVGLIALAELNAVAARAEALGEPLDMSRVDARLRRNMPLAVRVVMAWDTDDTDIDMWVTDPNGERASYANRLTYQGGAMSPDATGGYGPEEFSLKKAKPGKYLVQAQFYGNQQQVLSAGTTVMVRVTTDFGTPQAKDAWTSVRLVRGSEISRIAEVEVR